MKGLIRCAGTALAIGVALGCFTARATLAATYYVDGACSTSGNGSSLTCGAGGPFKTIMEGIEAMGPGGVLNIRGPHGSFDGKYNEYVGIWGNGQGAASQAPGGGTYKALNCTSASPCIIQGCPASACGSDEIPIISGLVKRTDWTQTTGTSGIWYRAMEVRNPSSGGTEFARQNEIGLTEGPADTADPVMMLYGTWPNLDWFRFSPGTTSPADGFWSYDAASDRAYINPPGSGNPNTGGVNVWVPDHFSMVVVDSRGSDNPSGSQIANNYLTFRRLIIEGGRWTGFQLNMGIGNGKSTTIDGVTVRYTNRMGIIGAGFQNLLVTNVLVEKMSRGTSLLMSQSCFGMRLFDIHTGTIQDSTFRNLGANLAGRDYYWAEPPWDQRPAGANPAAGDTGCRANGVDLKQSFDVTVQRVTTSHTSGDGLGIDSCERMIIQDSTFQHAYSCIPIDDGNNACTAAIGRLCVLNDVTIRRNLLDDCGYDTDSGGIRIENQSGSVDNIKIYDNVISRVSCAGVSTKANSDSISGVQIYNNTLWRQRGQYSGYANSLADAIRLSGSAPNVKIKNNIIGDFDSDFVEFVDAAAAGSSGLEMNYNLYRKNGSVTLLGGLVNWAGTRFSTLALLRAAHPTIDTQSIEGDPRFVNAGALDFRLCEGPGDPSASCTVKSPAIDAGTNMGLPFSGNAPDLGAVESGASSTPPAPQLLEVVPIN